MLFNKNITSFTEKDLKAFKQGEWRPKYAKEKEDSVSYELVINFQVRFFSGITKDMTDDGQQTDTAFTKILQQHTWLNTYHQLIQLYMEIAYPIFAYILVYRMPQYQRLFVRVRIFSFLPLIVALIQFHYISIITVQVMSLFIDEQINLKNIYQFICYQTFAWFCSLLIVYNCMAYIIICFIEFRNIGIAIILLQIFMFLLVAYVTTFFVVPAGRVILVMFSQQLDKTSFYYMQYVVSAQLIILIIQSCRCILALSGFKRQSLLEIGERLYVENMQEEMAQYQRNYLGFKKPWQDFRYGELSTKQIIKRDLKNREFDSMYTTLNDRQWNRDFNPQEVDDERNSQRTSNFSILEYIGYQTQQQFHDAKKSIYDFVIKSVADITAGRIIKFPDYFDLQTFFVIHPIMESQWEFIDYRDKTGIKAERTDLRMNFVIYTDVVSIRWRSRFFNITQIEVFKANEHPPLDFGLFKRMPRRFGVRWVDEGISDFLLKQNYLFVNRNMKFSTQKIQYTKTWSDGEDLVQIPKYIFYIIFFYLQFLEQKKVFIVMVFFIFVPQLLISYKLFMHQVAKRNIFTFNSQRIFVLFYSLIIHYFILIKILGEPSQERLRRTAIRKMLRTLDLDDLKGEPLSFYDYFDYWCFIYLIIYAIVMPIIFYDLFYRLNADITNQRNQNHAFDVQVGASFLYFQFVFILFTVPAVFCCFLDCWGNSYLLVR